MFWNIDLNIFPISYHELNLNAKKGSKMDLKVALRVGQILHRIAISLCFDCDHEFSLMEDVLLI